MSGNRLLVGSVGIGGREGYDETRYKLDGVGEFDAELVPVALANLLDVDSVLVPCTKKSLETHNHREKLVSGFEDAGVSYEFLDIRKVSRREDVDQILDHLVANIREREPEAVVLDITHAFRSLPMVFFASLIYVDALGDTDLDGIYYAEFQGEESPIIDLTYLYTLLEWYHALRSYENTGSLVPVAELLDEKKAQLFQQGDHPVDLASVTQKLDGASRYFDSGLPMEAGIATSEVLAALDEIDESQFVGPEGTFMGPLADELDGYGIQQDVSQKTDVRLTSEELERQAAVVELYRQKEKYWLAIECAREAFLNRALYEHGYRDPGAWLDRDTRGEVREESFYSGNGTDGNRSTQSAPVQLWHRLTSHRNVHAHAGFKQQGVPATEELDRVLEEVCERIVDDEFWADIG